MTRFVLCHHGKEISSHETRDECDVAAQEAGLITWANGRVAYMPDVLILGPREKETAQ